MSSVDSSLLSGASYLTHNIYAGIIRPASNVEDQVIVSQEHLHLKKKEINVPEMLEKFGS